MRAAETNCNTRLKCHASCTGLYWAVQLARHPPPARDKLRQLRSAAVSGLARDAHHHHHHHHHHLLLLHLLPFLVPTLPLSALAYRALLTVSLLSFSFSSLSQR